MDVPIVESPEQTAAAAKKILWVEDDAFLTNIIAHELSNQHWQVLYAREGVTSLAIAKSEKPDAIVLDIMLPGMDGFEVLKRLKADDETKDIPVVMFTNLDDPEKVELSKILGAEGFFVKALVSLDSIIAEIQKVISR